MTTATMALWLAMTPAPQYIAVPSWPQSLEPIVSHWADLYRVPRWLAMKTMMVESGGNPKATGNEWEKVKSRGKVTWKRGKVLAEGAFMITVNPEYRADHLKRAGMTLEEFDPWDVSDSARVGLCFLGYLLRAFPDIRPSVGAYNGGEPAVRRWYYEGKALAWETTDYIKKVLGRLAQRARREG